MLGALPTAAQQLVPSTPQQAPQTTVIKSEKKPTPSPGQDNSMLGGLVPAFDPGSETVRWDGQTWNVYDNRAFQARFEKFLNAAEATVEEETEYHKLIEGILDNLQPHKVNDASLRKAFSYLPRASDYSIDANLCDSLFNAIYDAWLAGNAEKSLARANEVLEEELKRHEWNLQQAVRNKDGARPAPNGKTAAKQWAEDAKLLRQAQVDPIKERKAQVQALVKGNELKKSVSEIKTKIEFQALILQFFVQRRFQHVKMATGFYRQIFRDGRSELLIEGDAKNIFKDATGLPQTLSTLETLASEAMRDAREGVEAYNYLLGKEELESATKRLAEAFVVGEYLPELRSLPREDKREALIFTRKFNQLLSALDVKDYTLAENIVKDLQETAKDFDNSKPMAAVETARTVSAMHLAKAKNAAVRGDNDAVEEEITKATEIWPRNPALSEVANLIFSRADVQQQALVDLDRLITQRNYRQIFEDRVRFIAAVSIFPERQDQLMEVLDIMQKVEGSIIRSQEVVKRGDYAGAWETVERTYREFHDDTRLNQVRADLTAEAADFVRCITTAERMEAKGQSGSSLAWYLKAQALYPVSEFAKEGIDRLALAILPEAASQSILNEEAPLYDDPILR
jgi:hypothetical protein